MDFREIIRSYVRDENPIWDEDTFDSMLNLWPNNKEITLYRGINFKTKADYEVFKEKLEIDGGYKQGSASSFSGDYDTAKGFAITSKSYFLDKDVMKANSVANILGEKVTGYRGVILKITVPPGSVVDVQKSEEGIENEYLFKPNTVIKGIEVIDIKTYYDLTQEDGFDVNKALEAEIKKQQAAKKEILSNSFINYLLVNHIDEISDIVKTMIVQNDIVFDMKRRENKGNYDDERFHVVVASPEISITYIKGYKYRDEIKNELSIQPIDFSHYEKLNLVTEDVKKIFQKIASKALQSSMEAHLKYRDEENLEIKYEALSGIVEYLSAEEKELHKRMIGYGVKQKYEDLNANIGKNFNGKGLKPSIQAMTNFLNSVIQNSVDGESKRKEYSLERAKRVKEAKEYRAKMLGLENEDQAKTKKAKDDRGNQVLTFKK